MDRFMRCEVGTTVLLPLYRSTQIVVPNPPLKYDIAVNGERVPDERGTGQETHVI